MARIELEHISCYHEDCDDTKKKEVEKYHKVVKSALEVLEKNQRIVKK